MRRPGLPGMETVERGERGIALVMVLIGLTLLLTVAGQFAAAMRLEGITTLNFRATLSATYLAEAAYHRAVAEILPNYLAQELDQLSLLVFRRAQVESPKAPAREDLALGPGRFSYRITDEQARLNLNSALATPENRAFVGAYERRYQRPPTQYDETGYTAALLLMKAVELVQGQVENVEGFLKAIREAAPSLSAPRGPIRFNENNQVITNEYISRVDRVGGRLQNVVIETLKAVPQFPWESQ